ALLGGVFEHSPWVAEGAWAQRPFGDVDDLHRAMVAVAGAAPEAARLSLLQSHPDLAGKLARGGGLTAASTAEQASAGLDRLAD
ncbi:2-oxo-4-hydroxy-4-carboxy-5-ureidoimidazoline decarboxylase, partial [Acinetobacter baumannii]